MSNKVRGFQVFDIIFDIIRTQSNMSEWVDQGLVAVNPNKLITQSTRVRICRLSLRQTAVSVMIEKQRCIPHLEWASNWLL